MLKILLATKMTQRSKFMQKRRV